MRILTVRQPWAWAIIHGGKTVENRVRNIAGSYRGPVLIHAGAELARDGIEPVKLLSGMPWRERGTEDVRGEIIGVVDLVDVHSASVIGGCGWMQRDCDEHPYGCRHHCSPWAEGPSRDGWYQHLVFENPRALDHPLPWKGALGLRKVDSLEIIGDWLAEVEPPCGRCAPPYGCPPGSHEQPITRLVATS